MADNGRDVVQHPRTGERMQRYLFVIQFPGVEPITVPNVDAATMGSLEEQGLRYGRDGKLVPRMSKPRVIKGRSK